MAVLHALALFLLCLVGYSAAVAASAGDPPPRPVGWELLLTAAAGAAAAVAAPDLTGRWLAFPLAVATGAVPGGCAGLTRRIAAGRTRRRGPGATPLYRRPSDETPSAGGRTRRFLLRMGDFQGRVTMGYLYFGLLAPFAALSRLAGDPLEPDPAGDGTFWSERPSDSGGAAGESLTRQS